MLTELNATTRRYPRTLSEAFPHDVDNAQWFYPPKAEWSWSDRFFATLGIMLWVGLAYYFSNN